MGPDCLTGRTLFLLANGSIVPRRPTTPFPDYFIPYDWTPKQFILRATLPPATPPAISNEPTPVDATQQSRISAHPINAVVQLPDTPTTEAIATVTGLLPSPLSVDLLSSLHTPPALNTQWTPTNNETKAATTIPQLDLATHPTNIQHALPPLPPPEAPPSSPTPPLLATLPRSQLDPPPSDPTIQSRRSQRTPLPPNFWRGCLSAASVAPPSRFAYINAI